MNHAHTHTHTHKTFFLLCHRAVTSYQLLRISKRFANSYMVLLRFIAVAFFIIGSIPTKQSRHSRSCQKVYLFFNCRFTTVVRVLENLCVAKTHARVQYTSTSVTDLPCSTSHSSQPATTKQLSTPSRSQMELPLRAGTTRGTALSGSEVCTLHVCKKLSFQLIHNI